MIDFMDKINDPFRKASGTYDQENPIMRYRRKSSSEFKKSDERDKRSRKHAIASGKGIRKNNVFDKIPSRDKSSLDRADVITDSRF